MRHVSLRVGGLITILFLLTAPSRALAGWEDALAQALFRRDYAAASRAVDEALSRRDVKVDEALLKTWLVREDVIENCPRLAVWIETLARRISDDDYGDDDWRRSPRRDLAPLEATLLDALGAVQWWEDPARRRIAARLLRRCVSLGIAPSRLVPRLALPPWRDSLATGEWLRLVLSQADGYDDVGIAALAILRGREIPVSQTVPILYAIVAVYGEDILDRGEVDGPATLVALVTMLAEQPERWLEYAEIEYVIDALVSRGAPEVDRAVRALLTVPSPWAAKRRSPVWRAALDEPLPQRRQILKDRKGLPPRRALLPRLWSEVRRWCPGALLLR